jgi:ribosomal protein L16 Arg81 hydroxylase
VNIKRMERLSVEDFQREYWRRNRPVIITGAVEDWPARSWTLETIAAQFGDEWLPVEVLGEDRADDNTYRRSHIEIEEMPLRRYLDVAANAGSRYYMAQVPFPKLSDRMRAGFGSFDYFPTCTLERTWTFFLGPPSARTGIHFDHQPNFVVQIMGHKRWFIFPKSQRRLLYVPNKELGHFSPIILESPDLKKFPKFSKATPVEFILGPGEILFVPRGWPHYVRSLDFTLTVNCFFVTPTLALFDTLRRLPFLLRATIAEQLRGQRIEHSSYGYQ